MIKYQLQWLPGRWYRGLISAGKENTFTEQRVSCNKRILKICIQKFACKAVRYCIIIKKMK
ncbi:hypothetical protein EAI88_06830 [Eubacterium ramulus]|nr:hypothetical protein EAI88_06830 [Eubacterium ramulus]